MIAVYFEGHSKAKNPKYIYIYHTTPSRNLGCVIVIRINLAVISYR